jgi:hypothetical protein
MRWFALMAPVYNRSTEGVDTAGLRTAGLLLDDMAGTTGT